MVVSFIHCRVTVTRHLTTLFPVVRHSISTLHEMILDVKPLTSTPSLETLAVYCEFGWGVYRVVEWVRIRITI